jgi:hypothetical protein
MKIITVIMLLFIVQMASAAIPKNNPINPTADGTNMGGQGLRPGGSLLFQRGTGTAISANGRYISYVTEHQNLLDTSTIDYIIHRYDRITSATLSSNRIINNSTNRFSFTHMFFENESAETILFTDRDHDTNNTPLGLYRYDFIGRIVSVYKPDVQSIVSVSPKGQFLEYIKNDVFYTFDKNSNEEKIVPITHTLENGNVIDFKEHPGGHGFGINDQGNMILKVNTSATNVDGVSIFYQYNIETEDFTSVKDMLAGNYNIDVPGNIGNSALISNNSQYITLSARNSSEELVILLIDTISSSVLEHKVPFDIGEREELLPRLLTDTGLVQYIHSRNDANSLEFGNGTDLAIGETYLYDFNLNRVINRNQIYYNESNDEIQVEFIDQISLEGNFVLMYDLLINQSDESLSSSHMYWKDFSTNNKNEISITPENILIDPYSNQKSQFSVDVSGANIYGLEVNCDLSSTSLSVTEANYNGLFGTQNTMALPLIYNASSITATETLIAPELSFTGDGSFVLVDVVADLTTEDVEITCAMEVLGENGESLDVVSTSATIHIDDGIHGEAGFVSGSIVIPGATDFSGVEAVLTIDDRQVTAITDETGYFEFEGLRDGDFTIRLEAEHYVKGCQAANVVEGGAVDLGSIELLAGDVNANGTIDFPDFLLIASNYRSNLGDDDYDLSTDLNRDGTINFQDIRILFNNYGSTQCNPLQ